MSVFVLKTVFLIQLFCLQSDSIFDVVATVQTINYCVLKKEIIFVLTNIWFTLIIQVYSSRITIKKSGSGRFLSRVLLTAEGLFE